MANPIIFAPSLSEAQLELLLPCFPTDYQAQEPSRRGRRSVSQETVLSVVVEKLRTGIPWTAFKSGISAYNHFQSWSESGAVQALWWVITNNPTTFDFCPKRLWAATSWLIKRDHITGPSENWLGKDFRLPKPPKPEFYGPKQEKKWQPAIYTFDHRFMEQAIPFVLEAYPEKAKGRSRLSMHRVFNGLLFQIRTGCQWKALPREFGHYSSVHKWKTKLVDAGVFDRLMALMLAEADSLNLIDWSIQALDGSYCKARKGGDCVGQNPTDRGKSGSKRSVLSDSTGIPLAIHIAGANVHDSQLVADTLAKRWIHPVDISHTLLLDRGYGGETVKKVVESYDYEYKAPALRKSNPYHILDQEYTQDDNRKRACVEWSHFWHQNYRAVATRYATKASNTGQTVYWPLSFLFGGGSSKSGLGSIIPV